MSDKNVKEIIDTLNIRLRNVETYQELDMLKKEVEYYDFVFASKRSRKCIYDISPVKEHWDKVNYLYNDGVSSGESYIKNLYKYFKIKE